MGEKVEVKFAGKVNVIKGKNQKKLYEHQISAMQKLDEINNKSKFNSLLVLPTGGGKTMTAVYWLLKEVVNKNKKIIWVAHRHLLLEQAAQTFKNNAYSDLLYNRSSFNYRIISGKHDKAIHIKESDDILILSKDSAVRNLDKIGKWIDKDEVYLIIDEAHHATAKSYRKLIDYVNEKCNCVKLLGLTATPFRTADNERGLLKKIFTDDIVFKTDLKDLIKKEILSRPQFEECSTEIGIGYNMGLNAIKSIEQLDNLPDDIANEIAGNKERNNIIVNQYIKNKDKYGQTIVFAVNRIHAITLKSLFKKHGIATEFIVSGTKNEFTGIDISNEDNERNIEEYRKGNINVLINVNILTEGVDLPKTKTVFLTRPTVSSILMTQMVGRALRGKEAGGTKEAYVVTFIDEWEEHIAWVNAESLIDEECETVDKDYKVDKKEVRNISIAKIEEFARIIDETVDTTKLESIGFMNRVPLGIYAFTFIDDNKMERNHQVLVYNSTKNQYEKFINELPLLFEEYEIVEEVIDENTMKKLLKLCKNTYFDEYMLPKYDEKDIRNILKYYAQKECKPKFIPFEELDRKKLDLTTMAKEIVNKDMRRSEIRNYIDNLWNEEDGIIRIYFNKKTYFAKQLQIEIDIVEGEFETSESEENFIGEKRELKELPLNEISKVNPEKAREIKNKVFSKYTNKDNEFYCNLCGYKSKFSGKFQIDHIKPISKGGLTELDNLQLLCTTCNKIKGDKYE